MAKIWILILLAGISTLLFSDPSAALAAMVKGSHDAVKLAMSLVALYGFWLGFFAILDKTGIAKKLAKLLRPLVRFLFPGIDEKAGDFVTMNMSANLLGLGNAATPMAIQAINAMDAGEDNKASINMIMLVVISSTSLQLLPTTVIGLRATHGSSNPTDFLIPCIIATLTSTFIGIFLVKILSLFKKKKTTAKAADNTLPANSAFTQRLSAQKKTKQIKRNEKA